MEEYRLQQKVFKALESDAHGLSSSAGGYALSLEVRYASGSEHLCGALQVECDLATSLWVISAHLVRSFPKISKGLPPSLAGRVFE